MTRRVLMTPERLLLSRPGFAAHAAMPHAQKAFDSDWAYAGQLIASGWENDPNPSGGPTTTNKQATRNPAPWVIDFPTCSFIPTVTLSVYFSPTYELGRNEPRADQELRPLYWEYIRQGRSAPYNRRPRLEFQVTKDKIIISRPRPSPFGGWWYRWRFAFYYQVFGFAG